MHITTTSNILFSNVSDVALIHSNVNYVLSRFGLSARFSKNIWLKKENAAVETGDIDNTDTAFIRRSNTIGNMPPAERPRSQIVRRNTAEPSKTEASRAKEALLPDKDVVYQHTTSVVKSVIEFNTGVQHATPDEFVDLVKVFQH